MAKQPPKKESLKKDQKDTPSPEPLLSPNDICFVVSPIGKENEEIRRDADRALKGIIKQGAKEAGFKLENVVRADEITKSGAIDDFVIEYLHTSKMVVADLTTVNPNVMFELALRYSFGKPVIHIKNKACHKRIPFDIVTQKTIFYTLDDTDLIDGYRTQIAEHIKECLESHNEEIPNNPVYKAISFKFQPQSIKYDEMNKDDQLLINIYNTLSNQIENLQQLVISNSQQVNNPIFDSANVTWQRKSPVHGGLDTPLGKLRIAPQFFEINHPENFEAPILSQQSSYTVSNDPPPPPPPLSNDEPTYDPPPPGYKTNNEAPPAGSIEIK